MTDGAAARALPFLEQAADRAPAVADFHNALGAAYFENDRIQEAIAAFRRAAALLPQNVDLQANLAEARQHLPEPICNETPEHRFRVLVLGTYTSGVSTIDHLIDTFSAATTADVDQRWVALGKTEHSNTVSDVTLLHLPADTSHSEAIAALIAESNPTEYEYVFLVEDPVVIDEHFVDRFLACQKKLDFAFAQPAIVPASRARFPLA